MPFIAFLGCDGSGKSSLIEKVLLSLSRDGHKCVMGHWRPGLNFSRSQQQSSVENPHGMPARGCVISLIKLVWLWANWWWAWIGGLGKQSNSSIVLYDRYHVDLLVDPRRYRYGGPMWAARLACRLMPKPDLAIYLDADPDTLLSRKQEVSREALEKARAGYLALVESRSELVVIDASQALDEVLEETLNHINQLMALKPQS